MQTDCFYVPPAAQLLVTEIAPLENRGEARKRLRSLLSDLRKQSEVYYSTVSTAELGRAAPLEFDIHLHGGVDILDKQGACTMLACRLKAADRLCRSMGLMADRVWISDFLTSAFVNFGRVTNEKLDELADDAKVLARLWPLVESGIIRFRPTWGSFCDGCMAEFESNIRSTADEIAKDFAQEITLECDPSGYFSIDTGKLFEPSVISVYKRAPKGMPTKEQILSDLIYNQVRTALWVGRDASRSGGAIFSNSRIGLAGLLQREGRFEGCGQLMSLDNQRSLSVPWVSELTASQILQLREEASSALPLFREKFAQALSAGSTSADRLDAAKEFIQELREQSHEVRAELQAAQKNSARYWKTTYALLGLGLSAYGVANDQVVAGVGGLLPLINLLISHKSGHEKDVSKLTARPGYVLVKAQDILAHAD